MAVPIGYRSTATGVPVLEENGLDGEVLSAEDLDVDGNYHIPKRKRGGGCN
jgi:hypothetical protein